jgi:hypothetical protein
VSLGGCVAFVSIFVLDIMDVCQVQLENLDTIHIHWSMPNLCSGS